MARYDKDQELNAYAGSKKGIERTKRELVEDIARFGSEGRKRAQRQADTVDAMTAADEPMQEAAGNADLLADMANQRDLITGFGDQDAADSKQAHSQSQNRLTTAHKQYLQKLKKAVPYHKREMDAYAKALAAAGRAGGGGGGGGGRGGSSPKQSSANLPDGTPLASTLKSIPDNLERLGMKPNQIVQLGQMVAESPDLFKVVDQIYAEHATAGKTINEANQFVLQNLLDAGMDQLQARNWMTMMGAKYEDAFTLGSGVADSFAPAFTPQTGTTFEDAMGGAFSGGPRQAPAPTGHGARTAAAPEVDLGKKVGSGQKGEVYYEGGVVWKNNEYTYEDWQIILENLEQPLSFFT